MIFIDITTRISAGLSRLVSSLGVQEIKKRHERRLLRPQAAKAHEENKKAATLKDAAEALTEHGQKYKLSVTLMSRLIVARCFTGN